ncbi:unnamed protein product, partial [Candidula unifasciata]
HVVTFYELNPTPFNVNFESTSPPIVILSPNYGRGNYPNDVNNFTLTIRSNSEPLVLVFYFRHFDLEYQRVCAFDDLSLQGIKYCGTWETGRSIPFYLPEFSSFVVTFKTDHSVTRSGFE